MQTRAVLEFLGVLFPFSHFFQNNSVGEEIDFYFYASAAVCPGHASSAPPPPPISRLGFVVVHSSFRPLRPALSQMDSLLYEILYD